MKLPLHGFIIPLSLMIAMTHAVETRAQDSSDKDDSFVRWRFENRPSLRFGSLFRIDLRAKAQVDARELSPHFETNDAAVDLNRIRLGIEGEFLNHFSYEVERDLCSKQCIQPGQLTIQADHGSSMTSKPVAFLLVFPMTIRIRKVSSAP